MSQAYLSHSGKYQKVQRHKHTPDWIHSSVRNSKMVGLVEADKASVVKLKHIAIILNQFRVKVVLGSAPY